MHNHQNQHQNPEYTVVQTHRRLRSTAKDPVSCGANRFGDLCAENRIVDCPRHRYAACENRKERDGVRAAAGQFPALQIARHEIDDPPKFGLVVCARIDIPPGHIAGESLKRAAFADIARSTLA
jgi:hypothetical protein